MRRVGLIWLAVAGFGCCALLDAGWASAGKRWCEPFKVIQLLNPCPPQAVDCSCPGWMEACPQTCRTAGCPFSVPTGTGSGLNDGKVSTKNCNAWTYQTGTCPGNAMLWCFFSCPDQGACLAPFSGPWNCNGTINNFFTPCDET
jgi:hypothetical protein